MLKDFKSTDLDPRELILLYKSLLVYNEEALKKHFTRTQFSFDLETIINQYKNEKDDQGLNVQKAIADSKQVVA
jgi:hypothetical protein